MVPGISATMNNVSYSIDITPLLAFHDAHEILYVYLI